MLCSECKKNVAVIFTNKKIGEENKLEGLCYSCAKKKGINPLEVLAQQSNLSQEELEDMTSQFEKMFNDVTGSLDLNGIDMNELQESLESSEEDDGAAIKSFISNIFGGTKSDENAANASANGDTTNNNKRVKTEKRPKEKKKSFLDIYGTN